MTNFKKKNHPIKKTPFGIYPAGNTGGANVWFFKPTPIPDDLQKMIKKWSASNE